MAAKKTLHVVVLLVASGPLLLSALSINQLSNEQSLFGTGSKGIHIKVIDVYCSLGMCVAHW